MSPGYGAPAGNRRWQPIVRYRLGARERLRRQQPYRARHRGDGHRQAAERLTVGVSEHAWAVEAYLSGPPGLHPRMRHVPARVHLREDPYQLEPGHRMDDGQVE